MPDLRAALHHGFLAELTEPARRALAGEPGLADALVAQWQAARGAWPDIAVAPPRFAGELARRIAAHTGGEASAAALAALHGSDVYLAVACCNGDAAAIATLDELVGRELRHAASKLRASPDQTAEVHAELRRILLVDDSDRGAALRDYAGRGDLRGYLRVSATRALIRAINRGRREIAVDDGEVFDRMLPIDDPELSILRAQYRDTVDAALRAALAGLDARARALLRYQLIDGWTIDQVGKLYGVHRASAARWLADARAGLGDAIRTELATRLRIATSEVDSIVRLSRAGSTYRSIDCSSPTHPASTRVGSRTPCRGHQRAPSAGAHRASTHRALDESLYKQWVRCRTSRACGVQIADPGGGSTAPCHFPPPVRGLCKLCLA